MLERILEPEVMDSKEEARTYDEMDHRVVNQRFVQDFLDAGFADGDVLDLGTGTAQIPIELVERIANCRVMAVDLSINMLERARMNVASVNQFLRIQLAHVDAKQLPYSTGMFDAVMSNSIVHHLPKPEVCLADAIRVVKASGLIFFRDLLRPDTPEQLDQLVAQYCGQEIEYAQQLFRESLQAALSLNEIRGLVAALGDDPQNVQQTSDRHWTWSTRKPDPVFV